MFVGFLLFDYNNEFITIFISFQKQVLRNIKDELLQLLLGFNKIRRIAPKKD
jgi:hypothetical protein